MTQDSNLVSERYLDHLLTEHMWAHGAAAYEDAAKMLRAKAGELYATGRRDEVARYLRDEIVPLLTEKARDYRARQEAAQEKRPPERDAEE
jgi:hypothetical protein